MSNVLVTLTNWEENVRTLGRSFDIELTIRHPADQRHQLRTVQARLNAALRAGLKFDREFADFTEVGRWAYWSAQRILSEQRLPVNFTVNRLVIGFFSGENASGRLLMRVDCLTGRVQTF